MEEQLKELIIYELDKLDSGEKLALIYTFIRCQRSLSDRETHNT